MFWRQATSELRIRLGFKYQLPVNSKGMVGTGSSDNLSIKTTIDGVDFC